MKNEERVVIPSPNVESYAKQPKMSAPEVTARLKKKSEIILMILF